MRTVRKLALCGLVACGASLATPAVALAQSGDEWTLQKAAKTKSDADKTIARAQMVTTVIERILKHWSFSAIRNPARKNLIHGMFDILRKERWEEDEGDVILKATVSLSEARQLILNELKVDKTFGRGTFICVPHPQPWYTGPEIGADIKKVLHRKVGEAMTAYLLEHRFRECPKEGENQKVDDAALRLGQDPDGGALKEFGDMFKSDNVASLAGAIRFLPYRGGAHAKAYQGRLTISGVKARYYSRDAEEIIARVDLMPDTSVQFFKDAKLEDSKIHSPNVGKNADLAEACEKYASEIGQALAIILMKRLFEKYYAKAVAEFKAAKAAPGPRECKGCGDMITDAKIDKCPACESPLPPAKEGASGPVTSGPGPVQDWHKFKLEFVGWGDADRDDIVKELGKAGFTEVEEKGSAGNVSRYECVFQGAAIIAVVNKVLVKLNLKDQAEVRKNRQNIIIKKGSGS